ncbi:MAG TPA: peroxiredoxin-like family protein [Solirubrobacteraceae bacterium]|jgi:peroxiredoxin|nr:peroxiredoxin-like family protein [Solirubrobacteraceae bacterium]
MADAPESTTLGDELRAWVEKARANRSDEVNAAMDELVESLRETTATATLRVGDPAPGFALPDAHGREMRLDNLLAHGPVVLVFYRGGWCPYCNLQLRAYGRALGEIEAAGGQLVAVSPQLPDGSLSTAEVDELAFPVLSDHGNRVARTYSLVFEVPSRVAEYYLSEKGLDLGRVNGDEVWELPVPATFVIDRSGRIAFADADPDYTRRTEPAAIVAALRELGS